MGWDSRSLLMVRAGWLYGPLLGDYCRWAGLRARFFDGYGSLTLWDGAFDYLC
jgi:hypothetical protein